MAPFKKNDRALFEGKLVEVLQVDEAGRRGVVRDLVRGISIPVALHDLTPVSGEEAASLLKQPKNPSSFSENPYSTLRAKCLSWQPLDGFGFHALLRDASQLAIVDHSSLCEQFSVTPSNVRGWIEGALRPSREIQRKVVDALVHWIDASRDRELLRAQESVLESVENHGSEERAPSQVPSDTPSGETDDTPLARLRKQIQTTKTQTVELLGRSFTIEYGVEPEGKWTATVLEEPSIRAVTDTHMEALLDVKALLLDHLERSKDRVPHGTEG